MVRVLASSSTTADPDTVNPRALASWLGHAAAAAVVAAGACLAAAVVHQAGGAGRAELFGGLVAYAGLGGLVYWWGLSVYGRSGALAALALLAWLPPVWTACGEGPAVLLSALLSAAALAVLARCLLDPTIQMVGLGGVLLAGALPAAAAVGESMQVAVLSFAAASLSLVGWRGLTTERWEPRGRVVQGAATTALIAWGLAAALLAGLAQVPSSLPSPEEYGWLNLQHVAGPQAPAALPRFAVAMAALLLIGLAAVRPWRRERRYSDGVWVIALLCLGWGERAADPARGFVVVAPFVALLAAGCWDHQRSILARRLATGVLIGLALMALLALPAAGAG